MKLIESYLVVRNNYRIWLSINDTPLDTDEVVEIRPVLVADEGKVCKRIDSDETFEGKWITDDISNYVEIDKPIDDEETEKTEDEENINNDEEITLFDS